MKFLPPLLLLALASVHAAPLLHEPFSARTTGNLPGQSISLPGFASGSVWDGLDSSFGSVVADAATVHASGLTWSTLATDAKHALVKGDDSNTRAMMDVSASGVFANAGLRDAGTNTIGGGAVQGSLYLSFVFRAVSSDRNNEYGGLQLTRTNTDTTGVLIGNGWNPWAYSIHLPQNGNTSVDLRDNGGSGAYLQMDNQPRLFVARIDYAANAPDTLTVWMDPDLGAAENAQNLTGVYMTTATGDFSFDRFFLRGGTTTRQFEFDEIRMGTTWGDVTPAGSSPNVLANDSLRVTLRTDGSISRLRAFRAGTWEEVAFRADNLRGPQWQVTTSGSTESIALVQDPGVASFAGTHNGRNYRFTYQLNGSTLELVARVENPGGSAWTPERATICLGINSYMEGYPEWNLRYFPTLLRCEQTHFWGYSMSPLGRILGYASKDPVASWRHDYEYGAHRILTSYLDLLQSDPVPARHPQNATSIPAGQNREWRISLFDIPSLEDAPAAFAAATAAPAIQASRYHGEAGKTTTLTIRGPLASLTHNGSPVSFSSAGDTHTATWTFPSTLGEHRILAANATGKTSECILVTRHPWSWYLKQARTEAINKPQKASTHTESWYGLYSGFLARKHFPNYLQDTAIQAKLDELFPLMYDTATSLPTVAPDRIQDHSSMAGVLVDRYQASGDITSLERASILCDYLITKQGADGAYYSGPTHYTSVIYIAKSIMEVMAEEKKLADAGSAAWQERYDRHYLSVKRAMDDLVARGADIGTEGQHTFEDGMISCSYTQLAEFALLQTDPAQRAIYTNAAVALVEFHRCLSQKLVPDGRLNGGSLRFWESQYDILANSSNMMGSPHGWSAWRLYGLRSLYELTGDPKYLRDAMNGLGSCVQTIHPLTGELRWGFIVDPSVRAGIFTEFPSNPGKGRCVPAVIGEQYLPMISGWYRAPANTLVSGYSGGNSNGSGLAPGESWPANWSPSGTWGGDGGCCDNDVHEIFKCLEEIALTSTYLILGAGNSVEVWNGEGHWDGETLVITPAEAAVSRVHINRPPGDTRTIVVDFGGQRVTAPATATAWVEKPADPAAGAALQWDNGAATGNWNGSDANWTGSTWNNSAPDHAIFNTTTGTITLTEAISAGSFTFGLTNANTTGTFTGSALAISGNLVAQADGNNYPAINPSLSFSNNVTVTGDVQLGRRNLEISGGIFTANRLVSYGSWGRLRINGGSVTITNGIDDSILPAGNTMSVVLQSGSLHTPYIKTTNNWGMPDGDGVYLNGGTIFATANSDDFIQTWTFIGNKNEVAVGTGGAHINTNGFTITITKAMKNSGGAGTLMKSGAGTLKLTAYNEYTGGTTIDAGTLVVESAGTLGSGNVTVNAAATCELRNPAGAIADAASVYLNGTGKLTIAAGVTEVVSGLSIDGVPQGAGSYDATSLASHINGGGSLQVLEGTVSLTTPRARQIIQRNGSNTASIVISGTYTGMPEHIEARAVIMVGSGNHGISTNWTTIVASPAGGTFSGALSGVAAGGWYQIEVRSVSGGTATSNIAIVQRVGVGDVYLTAGQSNSANYGEPGTNTDDRVSAMDFSTGAWTLAADPMPGADGSMGSVWTRLGPLLTSAENVPVGFVCVGIGGSMVSQWVPPSSEGYVKLKAAAQAFPAYGFRAVLWHQGESDSLASTTPADYQTRLQSIIAQVLTDSGWTMPWYVAEASFHPASTLAQEEPVVAGQRRVIHADPLVFAGPATDDFHREGELFDTVHFNAAGLTDHAQQWAEVLTGTAPVAAKNGNLESNSALADGGIAVVNMTDTSSNSVIGWRILNASGEAIPDGGNGYFNPDASFYADAVDGGASGGVLPNMGGRHVAFLYAGSDGNHFLQTRRASLQPNTTYALTVALGVRGNGNAYGNARIELLADGTSIASREITLADLNALNGGNAANKFTDVQLTYTSGTMVASGQPLSIRITKIIGQNSGNPTYLDFDNVRLTLSVTDYGGWATFHGITGGQTGDDDHDSMNNFAEYAFGTDPKNGSSVQPVILPVNPATGILTYTRRRQALTGLTYTVWFSIDLQTEWTQDSGAVQTVTGTSGDVETVQVNLSSSLLSNPRLFVRISSAQ